MEIFQLSNFTQINRKIFPKETILDFLVNVHPSVQIPPLCQKAVALVTSAPHWALLVTEWCLFFSENSQNRMSYCSRSMRVSMRAPLGRAQLSSCHSRATMGALQGAGWNTEDGDISLKHRN